LNLYYDKIVVGSSLRALLFAAKNDYPVFFSKPEKPHKFDFFPKSANLSSWKLHNDEKVWKKAKGRRTTGQPKFHLWEHVLFVLGLKGLVPFSDFCYSLRFDKNTLTGFSEYAKLRTIEFGVCYYFDEHGTYNLLRSRVTEKKYIICDTFAFLSGGKHHIDLIESKSDFCNKIWFHPTTRRDIHRTIKDAWVLSKMSEDQIGDFDFSETIVRLTMIEKMERIGLKGKRNGYYKGVPRYGGLQIKALNRYKFLSSPPLWYEENSIKVPKITEKTLLSQLPKIAEKQNRILRYLWRNT